MLQASGKAFIEFLHGCGSAGGSDGEGGEHGRELCGVCPGLFVLPCVRFFGAWFRTLLKVDSLESFEPLLSPKIPTSMFFAFCTDLCDRADPLEPKSVILLALLGQRVEGGDSSGVGPHPEPFVLLVVPFETDRQKGDISLSRVLLVVPVVPFEAARPQAVISLSKVLLGAATNASDWSLELGFLLLDLETWRRPNRSVGAIPSGATGVGTVVAYISGRNQKSLTFRASYVVR